MAPKTAIIAGRGALPVELARRLEGEGTPFLLAQMLDNPLDNPGGWPVLSFRMEQLCPFCDALHDRGVERLVLAGAVIRPTIDPAAIDPATARIMPEMQAALRRGDDALLTHILGFFEEQGFQIAGATDLMPELLPTPAVLSAATPSDHDRSDAARAAEIVTAIGAADIGQGAVVAQGLCLAVETLPGTDAMLGFVAGQDRARLPYPDGPKGVFFKGSKPGQDLRVDRPTIGPGTVRAVAKAGLAGLAIEAGTVILLDGAACVDEANRNGIFLWVRDQ